MFEAPEGSLDDPAPHRHSASKNLPFSVVVSRSQGHLEASLPNSNLLRRLIARGKALYSYADPQRGVVYIGGDKAYQRYRQLALQQSIEEKEVETSYSNYLKTIDQEFSENYD